MSDINYHDKTLTIADLKARLAYLTERHKYGQPEEDASDTIWNQWDELEALKEVEHDLNWCWDEDYRSLIHEDFWQSYCEDTCYTLGDLELNGIVASFVNWEGVADAMRQDYKYVKLPDNQYFYTRA